MNSPKVEVIFENPIVVRKSQEGTFYVYVGGVYANMFHSQDEVANWFWFNWPFGTRVSWVVMPW